MKGLFRGREIRDDGTSRGVPRSRPVRWGGDRRAPVQGHVAAARGRTGRDPPSSPCSGRPAPRVSPAKHRLEAVTDPFSQRFARAVPAGFIFGASRVDQPRPRATSRRSSSAGPSRVGTCEDRVGQARDPHRERVVRRGNAAPAGGHDFARSVGAQHTNRAASANAAAYLSTFAAGRSASTR